MPKRKLSKQDCRASLTKGIASFYRALSLGSASRFLQTIEVNEWFDINFDPLPVGWFAFSYFARCPDAPPLQIEQFAPYITAAKFFVTRYVKKQHPRRRERLYAILHQINLVMRRIEFPESLKYGKEPDQMREEDKHIHRRILVASQVECPIIPGTCLHGGVHRRVVLSDAGYVCTDCGQLSGSNDQVHYETKLSAKIKLMKYQTLTGSAIVAGSMSLNLRRSDPLRSITRYQFIARTKQPIRYVYSAGGSWARTVPPEFRKWLVYLYDGVKDDGVDCVGRKDRIGVNWARSIWIHGYLVWIALGRFFSNRREAVLTKLVQEDTTGTYSLIDNVRKYRCLEAQYTQLPITYFRVRGSEYRFYPTKFLPEQYETDPVTHKVYADGAVRALCKLAACYQNTTSPKSSFWNKQYLVCVKNGSLHLRTLQGALECYVYFVVPRHASFVPLKLIGGKHIFEVQPWKDPDLDGRAVHYFIHMSIYHAGMAQSVLRYRTGGTVCEQLLTGIGPCMKKQKITIASTRCLYKRAPLILTEHVREMSILQYPPN